ncbi:MAG: class A beta-lactamase-related serine hydrolase [Clostridia bacterium]|nr:class A beta-lactamase-related serine hydrolase [Clostridia bacterium]
MKFDNSLPLKERLKKRRRLKRIRFFSIFIVILFIVWFSINVFGNHDQKDKLVSNQATPGTSTNISEGVWRAPSASPTSTPANTPLRKSQSKENLIVLGLEKELNDYLRHCNGQYGVYLIDLVDNNEFGINYLDTYNAASTTKIPLNLYLYQKVLEGAIQLKDTLTYKKEDFEEGTGEIQYRSFGESYTIRELSKFSIVYSDNVATNMLFRIIGRDTLKRYMRDLGGVVVDEKENVSCPRDMALYMKLVYTFYKKNDKLGPELMKNFENTVFNDRLPAQLPKSIKVAHKTGDQVKAVHDIGIIFTGKPYVLAVMSKNVEAEEGAKVIAEISKKVYDKMKTR